MATTISLNLADNDAAGKIIAIADAEEALAIQSDQLTESQRVLITVQQENVQVIEQQRRSYSEFFQMARSGFAEVWKAAKGVEAVVGAAVATDEAIQKTTHGLRILNQVMSRGGSALLGATVAWQGFRSVLARTGEDWNNINWDDATDEQVEAFNKLADVSRRTLTDIETLMEQQGKSWEDFGARAETNLDRVDRSLAKLGMRFGEFGGEVGGGLRQLLDSLNPLPGIVEAVDVKATEMARNMVANNESMGRGLDEVLALWQRLTGDNAATGERVRLLRDMADETERVTEAQREQQQIALKMKDIDAAIADQIRLQQELARVSGARTQAELDAERQRLNLWKQDRMAARDFDEQQQAEYNQRSNALAQRSLQIQAELHQRFWASVDATREEAIQRGERREKERREAMTRAMEENRKLIEQQAALDRQIADARRQFQLATRNGLLDEMRLRAELAGDQTAAHELRLEQIQQEMDAAIDAADTELEKRQAEIDGTRRLQDARHGEKMRQIQAEHQAEQDRIAKEREARQQADAELKKRVAEQRAMLEQNNLPQKMLQQFSPQQVMQQILKQRQQAGGQQWADANRDRLEQVAGRSGDLSQQERLRLRARLEREFAEQQRQIARQTFRDAQQGGIGQPEVQQAQGKMMQGVLNQARESGNVSRESLGAMEELTNLFMDEAQENARMRHEWKAYREALKDAQEDLRGHRRSLNR